MIGKNDTLESIKYEILYQVAKHAYAGDLKEVEPELPYEMVQGPLPTFRCCIYRECEIVRQRIRMAQGLPPVISSTNRNTIQIITSACEGCPITRYVVADSEADEWAEAYEEGKKMTTSCCPAFVNMIKKHFPELLAHMSTTVSPMAAVARYVRKMEPEAVTVFIGPCIAKKSEVCNERGMDNADYALTFEELVAMFGAKNIAMEAKRDRESQLAQADQRTIGDSIKTVTDTYQFGMHRPQS